MVLAFTQREMKISYSTGYPAMKQHQLLQKKKRHPTGSTQENDQAQKSGNIIHGNFDSTIANQKWLSDITEIPCSDGKLYCCAVLDCFYGLAMEDYMSKKL